MGFTLVEIIVVLVILGLTAAVVIPAFARTLEDDPETAAARQLERILLDARATALTRAVPVRVVVVPETGRYWVYEEANRESIVLDSGAVTLDPGTRLWSPNPRPAIRFSAAGVADGDSLVVLGTTGARALALARWTGEVHAEAR